MAAEKAAPMGSAPMKYRDDGAVDWGDMWDTFCALAQEGGPPHRNSVLRAPPDADPESAAYRFAVEEITRGIEAVSGLRAEPAIVGWLAVRCGSASMARWLSEAIAEERVEARCEGALLLVPVGEWTDVQGEIKNVITVVAKTTHYWREHLPAEVKQALAAQERIEQVKARVAGWAGRLRRGRGAREARQAVVAGD